MLRFAVIASCLVTIVSAASGQAFLPIDRGASAGRFIEPPRSVTQQLRVAQEAIDQRRYGEAVAALGDLLQRERTVLDDELSGQDFFIADGNGIPTAQVNNTLMGEARRLLSTLPAEGIAQYELVYGAQAKKLLDDAAPEQVWGDVAEVKRRFFHTEAGRDATQLLIHRAIAQGHFVQAQRLSVLLLEHPKLDQKTKSLISALIQSLDQVSGSQTVSADGNAGSAAPTFAAVRRRRVDAASEFRMYPGRSVPAQSAGGQMPLPDPLYTVVTTGSERQERTLRESVDAMSAMGELPPPSWLPLRIGNQLLMRTTERLVGVDVVTGKRVWQYPWFETNEKIESTEATFDGLPEEDSGNSLLKQRVWNDLPYGRMSSDGERVYVLGDLAQMQVAMFSPLMGMQGSRPADTGTNSLIALDLATQGKLVWQLGGDTPLPDGLAQAFFLGAPLPIEDALYVMAEISGDIVLLCLDSATGTERWRQQLLAIETGSIDTDPVRRVAGASASYQDGILVCTTGAGAIVAVDIHDRALLWGVTIERNDAINQSVIVRRDGFIPDQLTKRWWDATPVIVGKTVYVTPIEADRFFALDLLTGDKRWKEFARAQTGSRYLAGVHEDSIVLVGGDNVRAVDAKTGKTTWKTRSGWLDSGEQISGLGMFGMIEHPASKESVAAYYVPTSANRIIAVSLQDGSALEHQTTSFPAGNLIAVEGQIISQAATLLSVAEGQVSLAPKVAAALSSDPNNVIMMNRKAQLLMEQGQRVEALKWLDKARAIEPDNIEVQQLTINAMFGALRDDFAGNAQMLGVLDGLIDQPADRAELIKLQVRAAIVHKRPLEAVERLIDLSSLLPTDPMLAAQTIGNEADAARQVSLDSWINARVMEALASAQPDQRDAIAAAVSTHLEKYAANSTPQVQRLVLQFGSLPGAEPLIRQLLQRYTAEQQWLAMERVILGSASATPERLDRLSTWQAVAIASAYAGGGLKQDAAAALEVALQDEAAARQAAIELGVDLDELRSQSAGNPYTTSWEGKVKVQLPNEPLGDRMTMSRRISTGENKRVVGRSFAGWQLVSEDSSPVALRDPMGIVHPIPVDGRNRHEEAHRQVVFNGGLMIALLPGELVAVNLFELVDGQADPVLWRRPWRSEGGGSGFRPQSQSTKFGDQSYRYLLSSSGNSVVSELQLGPIVGDTFYLLQGNELIAMDAITKA
ncbi:MAG: PQQ-binding-like beta-propeller repeat protein, partial [Planctomycetaceae bacterium]